MTAATRVNLVDAQSMARKHPSTFEVYKESTLKKLKKGAIVKVSYANERFWVTIVKVIAPGEFEGVPDVDINTKVTSKTRLRFSWRHIYDIHDSKAPMSITFWMGGDTILRQQANALANILYSLGGYVRIVREKGATKWVRAIRTNTNTTPIKAVVATFATQQDGMRASEYVGALESFMCNQHFNMVHNDISHMFIKRKR